MRRDIVCDRYSRKGSHCKYYSIGTGGTCKYKRFKVHCRGKGKIASYVNKNKLANNNSNYGAKKGVEEGKVPKCYAYFLMASLSCKGYVQFKIIVVLTIKSGGP